MATTMRNMRLDDELWAAVMEKAQLEDRSASEVVRELLTLWVAKPPKKKGLKTWRESGEG